MPLHVDENNLLQPLGLQVLRDNRTELLPATRDYEETVPGRPGAYDFGCDLEPRVLELHCCVNNITQAEWAVKRAKIAGALNPLRGTQELTFASDPGKVYRVRYAGRAELLLRHARYIDFTLPFKMYDPLITATVPNELKGSGMAVNKGNIETPCEVEIIGPVTNPAVQIGSEILEYTGQLTASDTLIIDSDNMTCTFNGVNALANYNGVFVLLSVGDNMVIAADGGSTTVRWYDRWI